MTLNPELFVEFLTDSATSDYYANKTDCADFSFTIEWYFNLKLIIRDNLITSPHTVIH